MSDDGCRELNRAYDGLEQEVPDRLSRAIRWLRDPKSRKFRIPIALLFLVENRENWTVSLGLSQLAGSIEVSKTTLMAGSVILTVPIIVLFFATERLLVEGLTSGAEKG